MFGMWLRMFGTIVGVSFSQGLDWFLVLRLELWFINTRQSFAKFYFEGTWMFDLSLM